MYFKIGIEDFLYYLNNFFGTLVNREDSGVQSALNFSFNTIYENLQKNQKFLNGLLLLLSEQH